MQLSNTSLPDVTELTLHTDVISLVPESDLNALESNAVITSCTPDITDIGITLSISGSDVNITGSYQEQFTSEIGYAEPQIDPTIKPVYVEVSNWPMLPEPTDTDNIWFLYKYKAPDILQRTVSFAIEGTYDYEELLPTPTPAIQKTFTGIATKIVSYDTEANVTEFKRYI